MESSSGGKLQRLASRIEYNTLKESNSRTQPNSYDRQALQFLQIVQQSAARNLELQRELDLAKERLWQVHLYPANQMTCSNQLILSDLVRGRNSLIQEPPIPRARIHKENAALKSEFNCNANCSVTQEKDTDLLDLCPEGCNGRPVLRNNRVADRKYYYGDIGSVVTKDEFEHSIATVGDIQANNNNDEYDYYYYHEDSETVEGNPYSVEIDQSVKESKEYSEFENFDKMDSKDQIDLWGILGNDDSQNHQSHDEGNGYVDEDEEYDVISDKNQIILPDELSLDLHDVVNVNEFQHNCSNSHKSVPQNMRMSSDANGKNFKRFSEVKGPVSSIKSYILSDPSSPSYLQQIKKLSKSQKAPTRCKPTLNEATTQTAAHKAVSAMPRTEQKPESVISKECKDIIIPKARALPRERNNFIHRLSGKPRTSLTDEFSMEDYGLGYVERNATEYERIPSEVFKKWKNLSAMFNEAAYEHQGSGCGFGGISRERNEGIVTCNWEIDNHGNDFDVVTPSFDKAMATYDKTANTLERPLANYDGGKVYDGKNEVAGRIIRCNGVPIKYFNDSHIGTAPATPSLEQKCSSDYIDQALEEAINDKNMRDFQNVAAKDIGRYNISTGVDLRDAQIMINKENMKHRNFTNSNSHDYQVKNLVEHSDNPESSTHYSLKVIEHNYCEYEPNNGQSSSNLDATQNPSSPSKTNLIRCDQLPKNFRTFCQTSSSQNVSRGNEYFKTLIVDECHDTKNAISLDSDFRKIRGCNSERSLNCERSRNPRCKSCQHHQKEFGNIKSISVCPSTCDCSQTHNLMKLKLHKCDVCESMYCSPCSEGSVSSSGDMIANHFCHSEDSDSSDETRQTSTNTLILNKFEPSCCQESYNTRCDELVNCENQIKFCFENVGAKLASENGFQGNNANNNNNNGSIHLATQRVNALDENMFCRHCNTIFNCFSHHWNDLKPDHSKCDFICIQQFTEIMKNLKEHLSSCHQETNEFIRVQVNNDTSPECCSTCPLQNFPRKSCDQSREARDNKKDLPELSVQKSNILDVERTSQEHNLESSILNLTSSNLDDITNISHKNFPLRLLDKHSESLHSDFDQKSEGSLYGKDNGKTFLDDNPKVLHTYEPDKLKGINKDEYMESVSNGKLQCNQNNDFQAVEINKGNQPIKELQIHENGRDYRNKISEFDLYQHFANDDIKNNYFEEIVSNSRIHCKKLKKCILGQFDISSLCSEERSFQLNVKNVREMLKSKSEAKFEINCEAKKTSDRNNNNSSRKYRKASPTISRTVKEYPDSRRLVKEILCTPRNVRRHRSQHPFVTPKYSADHSLVSMQSVRKMLRERDETRNLLLSELERLRDTLKKERLNFIGELSATRKQMIDYELDQKKKMECLEKTVCERLEMYDKFVKSHPAPHNIDFANLLFPPKNGSNVNPESFVDPSIRSNANSIHQNPDFHAVKTPTFCQNQVKASTMSSNLQPNISPNTSDNAVMFSPSARYTSLKNSPIDHQAQNAINIAMKAREPISASMRFFPPTLLLNSSSRKNEQVDFSTYRQAINNCAGQTATFKENILGNWTKEVHNNLPTANKVVPNMTYPRASMEQASHFVNPNGAIAPNFPVPEKTQNSSNTFHFSSFQNNPAEHPMYRRCNGMSNLQAPRIQENGSARIANQLVGNQAHTGSNLNETIFSSQKKHLSETPENLTSGVENIKRGYISADKQEPYVTLLSNKMSSSLRNPEVVIQAHQMNKEFQRHKDMSRPMRSLMCQLQNSSRNNSNSKCLLTLPKGEEFANIYSLKKDNHVSRNENEIENVTEVDAKCKQKSFLEKHYIINSLSKNQASQSRVLCNPCFSTSIEPDQQPKAFFEKYSCCNKLQKLDFHKKAQSATPTDHRFHLGISGHMIGGKPKALKGSHFQSDCGGPRFVNLFHHLLHPHGHGKGRFSSRSSVSKPKASKLFTCDPQSHKEMRIKRKFGSSRRFRISGARSQPQGSKRLKTSKKSTSVGSLRPNTGQGCNSISTYFSRWSTM